MCQAARGNWEAGVFLELPLKLLTSTLHIANGLQLNFAEWKAGRGPSPGMCIGTQITSIPGK